MGMLVDGVWQDVWYDTKETKGHFKRAASQFRNWITADGSAGPTGSGGFKAEAGRYHLYVSLACPWAHRTLIFRKLKKLEELISVSVVDPLMLEKGWEFKVGGGATGDLLFGTKALSDIYVKADPHYSGRVTVPVLWDTKTNTIVSNESSEIIRMFNTAFNGLTGSTADFYPEELRTDIDDLNAVIYDTVNNGVYKAGFATAQDAYSQSVAKLFETLDMLEERLGKDRYLFGSRVTEADWRLFTTLVRFDPGLCRPLQVQHPPHRRLSEPAGLFARSLPGAGDQGDRQHRAHQGSLLSQPQDHQSDRHRARWSAARSRSPAWPRRTRGSLITQPLA
jgi:putative glutathione S-transferase